MARKNKDSQEYDDFDDFDESDDTGDAEKPPLHYEPPEPTGYTDTDIVSFWQTAPGFEVVVHISPETEPNIEQIMSEQNKTRADVIGGFVYAHFEFVEEDVHELIRDWSGIHSWLVNYSEYPLAAMLIVQGETFNWFLLSADEAGEVQNAVHREDTSINLGWVTIFFQVSPPPD